ncbi:MAG: BatD family protein [Bacteroidota bacterium]
MKTKFLNKILFYCFAFFAPLVTLAQEASFTASASKTKAEVGDQIQISFTLNTSGSGFKAPNLNDFAVVSGPNQSTSMQFINGSMSQTISLSYIIIPQKEGKFTIGSAFINAGGKVLQTKPFAIEVAKGSGKNTQQNSNQGAANSNAQVADMDNNLFLKASVNKNKVYLGEQVIVTYKVYTRVDIVENGLDKAPVFNGFWSEDIMSPNQQAELYPEIVDGVKFQVAEIKKTILIPQRTGTLQVESMDLNCVARVRRQARSNDIFEQFFGGGHQDVRVTIKSKPIKIEVMPLPEAGKPIDFNGAVGEFSIASKINKNKFKTNDGANLIYTISGKGNLKLIEDIKPNFPSEVESYDPKISDKINASAGGLSGSRTYDYLIIPRVAGKYEIPEQTFSYFDPSKKTYVTLRAPNFELDVEQGSEKQENYVVNSASKEEIKDLGNDIKYIKTESKFSEKDNYIITKFWFYLLLLLPIVASVAFLQYYKKFQKENSNISEVKSRKANKVALQQLAAAQQHLTNNQFDALYTELYKAITMYLANKFIIPVSELNKENIASKLSSNKINENIINRVLQLLDKSEMARFSPIKETMAMEIDFKEATSIITEIEEGRKV